MNSVTPIVKGLIRFTKNVSNFSNATIHVQLEDFSRSDAAALLLAETIIKNVKHDSGPNQSKPTIVPFEIYLKAEEKIDSRNFYAVRVWVDIDSDGKNSSRDLNTNQSFRVLTHEFGNFVEIGF